MVKQFDGCTAKVSTIIDGFKNRVSSSLSIDETDIILERIKTFSKPVVAKRLGSVGNIESMPKYYDKQLGSFTILSEKNHNLNADIPYIIEI